jgi:hypothetical protein
MSARLPNAVHALRPWLVHDVVPDFRLEDCWALPTPGGPDDFGRLLELVQGAERVDRERSLAGLLWAARWKLGELLGWDDPGAGLDGRVRSLRERLPAEARDAPPGPAVEGLPFVPLYLRDNEYAAEIANKTVHGVLHVGWVPDGDGSYRGEMAVYVKPNGLLGEAYLLAIKPFRHLVVYPAMLRRLERLWRAARPVAVPA